MKKKLISILCLTCIFFLVACSNENEDVKIIVNAEEKLTIQEDIRVSLTSLGRASIRLDFSDGQVVYIDPYAGTQKSYESEADLVLVTHQHSDHNAIDRVTLKEDGQVLMCPMDIRSGMTKVVSDLEITAVDAYNKNHAASESCGFIIQYKGIVIYHSGDTSMTESMADLSDYDIDYALLCMDGFYNMGPEEAMLVADLIDAQVVIPIHTSSNGDYNQQNVDSFLHDAKEVLKIGESLLLTDMSHVDQPFEEAVVGIFSDRLKAIQTKDYDLYMASITKRNPYFYNEQERWFMGMTDHGISDVHFTIDSTEIIDEHTALVHVYQTHKMDRIYDLSYPLLFKYEKGHWKDYGYAFETFETERFTVKYMKDEKRVDAFSQMLSDAFDHLDALYEEKPHPWFEMKLFTDQEMLRQRTIPANGWLFAGWSEPDESLKLFTGYPEAYKGYPGVIQHEVVHHITIRICNNNLALWLLEGIAMYDGSAYYGFETSSLLAKMTKDGVSQTIAELEAIDMTSNLPGEVILNFYNTSYMYVRYITETYGRDTLMALFYEAGKNPFHDSTLNETFETDNQVMTAEVLKRVLNMTKEELSEGYLSWLETVDVF